jgi:hypothetical protein
LLDLRVGNTQPSWSIYGPVSMLHMGGGSGVLARGSAAPRSTKSNGVMSQTLADLETTTTKEMKCLDLRDG